MILFSVCCSSAAGRREMCEPCGAPGLGWQQGWCGLGTEVSPEQPGGSLGTFVLHRADGQASKDWVPAAGTLL